MRILVIDDDDDVRETLKDMLELDGHEVLLGEDGASGLKLAEQEPDFIFCDIDMPRLSGLQTLEAVRQSSRMRNVPFVFLTGRVDRDDQREGMARGADDYITKPFTRNDIVTAIAARTGRLGAFKERIAEITRQQKQEAHAQWSHELLTPLNAILGSLEVIESAGDDLSPAEMKEMLSFLRQGAERQERLARKLIRYFNLEQLSHEPAAVRRHGCGAAMAIRSGVEKAQRETVGGGNVSVAAAAGEVKADLDSLAYAIGEVVGNAIAFSEPGRPVGVTGTKRDNLYVIEIVDEGPGLTAEQRQRIGAFTQFERKVREQQGLGLGLAIARATASLAGGRLRLDARQQGPGLSVAFDLPLAD